MTAMESATESTIDAMLAGRMSEPEMAAFLTALADRGESVADIVGAARALRRHVTGLYAPADAIDCCGTGGDGLNTLNVSTAVAFVLAACGVPVAKHGNRAASSRSGAADVLEKLNIPLDVSFDVLEDALDNIGFCFLMAPLHHRAMAHVAPVRKALARRTIFNLLGPLANPAAVRRQMVGVYAPRWVRPMAEALKELRSEAAWVVHGDGMDEISLSGPTQVAMLAHGAITETTLTHADFGLPQIDPQALRGGDAAFNARALKDLLTGEQSAYRDTVLANAAAALVMTGNARDLKDGVRRAAAALDDGDAMGVLDRYREILTA
ncbi:MAG: anthranilate phosphoribosyltransferase [Alphaproteobacteria bacterium]|nr:anthranilate phosphoribosyltransferase [Alphaproteobacteria bacterium]USO07758.1 MAG: anthranilate phosphoribosyltransferase [Rhodospirillales bacterium]